MILLAWMDSLSATEFAVSAITKAEIELGIALLPDGKRKTDLAHAAKLMSAEFSGRCLSFDSAAASRYADIVAGRTRKGRPVSVEDAQIAAIALVHDMTVATRNTNDFELIRGLTIVTPWNL